MCEETLLIANDTWMAVCGTELDSNTGACHKRTHVRNKLTASLPNVGKTRNGKQALAESCLGGLKSILASRGNKMHLPCLFFLSHTNGLIEHHAEGKLCKKNRTEIKSNLHKKRELNTQGTCRPIRPPRAQQTRTRGNSCNRQEVRT